MNPIADYLREYVALCRKYGLIFSYDGGRIPLEITTALRKGAIRFYDCELGLIEIDLMEQREKSNRIPEAFCIAS